MSLKLIQSFIVIDANKNEYSIDRYKSSWTRHPSETDSKYVEVDVLYPRYKDGSNAEPKQFVTYNDILKTKDQLCVIYNEQDESYIIYTPTGLVRTTIKEPDPTIRKPLIPNEIKMTDTTNGSDPDEYSSELFLSLFDLYKKTEDKRKEQLTCELKNIIKKFVRSIEDNKHSTEIQKLVDIVEKKIITLFDYNDTSDMQALICKINKQISKSKKDIKQYRKEATERITNKKPRDPEEYKKHGFIGSEEANQKIADKKKKIRESGKAERQDRRKKQGRL